MSCCLYRFLLDACREPSRAIQVADARFFWVRRPKLLDGLDLLGGCHGINGNNDVAFLSLVPTPNVATCDPLRGASGLYLFANAKGKPCGSVLVKRT
jgi:hypothetical protein